MSSGYVNHDMDDQLKVIGAKSSYNRCIEIKKPSQGCIKMLSNEYYKGGSRRVSKGAQSALGEPLRGPRKPKKGLGVHENGLKLRE